MAIRPPESARWDQAGGDDVDRALIVGAGVGMGNSP